MVFDAKASRVFGTAGHSAPERLTPGPLVGPAVDGYGLGAMLDAALLSGSPAAPHDQGETTLIAGRPALSSRSSVRPPT